MTLIKTSSLVVQHNPTSAPLSFPDIAIETHEKILVLGASGCGKTTLLSVLAGLTRPTSGQVLVNDADFYSLSPKDRDLLRGKLFGFVFQTLHLLPSLTVAQNILLAPQIAGTESSATRLEKLLLTLGLTDKAHRKPSALSQGEQQRAALARAVFNSPPLIIADEPTSALDNKNADIVMDLLEQQAAETGATLLVATHDSRIKNRFDKIITLQ